jgi:hypothetical protein
MGRGVEVTVKADQAKKLWVGSFRLVNWGGVGPKGGGQWRVL